MKPQSFTLLLSLIVTASTRLPKNKILYIGGKSVKSLPQYAPSSLDGAFFFPSAAAVIRAALRGKHPRRRWRRSAHGSGSHRTPPHPPPRAQCCNKFVTDFRQPHFSTLFHTPTPIFRFDKVRLWRGMGSGTSRVPKRCSVSLVPPLVGKGFVENPLARRHSVAHQRQACAENPHWRHKGRSTTFCAASKSRALGTRSRSLFHAATFTGSRF